MREELKIFYKNNGCGKYFIRDGKIKSYKKIIGKCGSQWGLCSKCESKLKLSTINIKNIMNERALYIENLEEKQ